MKDASHHTRPPRASSRATEGDSPSLGRPTTTCARLGQLGHQKVSGSEARAGSGQEAGALSSSSFTERGSLGYGSNVKWQPRPIHMRWPCTTRNHERCHSGKAMCTHVCVCECLCMCVRTYMCMCACMCARVCTHVGVHVCAYMRACVCMHGCVRTCTYACQHMCTGMHTCLYACVFVCLHKHVHLCMLACIHVCIHVCMCVYVCAHVCVCLSQLAQLFHRWFCITTLTSAPHPSLLLPELTNNAIRVSREQSRRERLVPPLMLLPMPAPGSGWLCFTCQWF